MPINIKNIRHIHFVGIKGVGMTALALCAQDLGIKVTGSDVEEIFITDEVLKKRGISWSIGFLNQNLPKTADLVITTGAHGGLKNPEVLEAEKLGIPVLTQGESLAEFAKGKKTISVCGVGGKSTISALIATILGLAGKKPSYAIGVAKISPIGDPGRYTAGDTFVCEADEFVASPGVDETPKFMYLDPFVTVVTNIEHDHPDIYPTLDDTKDAYLKFFKKLPEDGLLVANIDNENVRNLISDISLPIKTYGFSADADYRISSFESGFEKKEIRLSIKTKKGQKYGIKSSLPGEYNALNITAAFCVCEFLGIKTGEITRGIRKFLGTKRRFEKIGRTKNGILVIDDYAHHPTEIELVIRAARQFYPEKRMIAVFQPHTYSRTKVLFKGFAESFSNADVACLMDIYSSAREKKDESVSSEKLAKAVAASGVEAYYTRGHEETVAWLKKNLKKGDLLLTLGAGDIFYIHGEILEK